MVYSKEELKDEKYIDGFRGIYMPYWAYHVSPNSPVVEEKQTKMGSAFIRTILILTVLIWTVSKGISFDMRHLR